jgi:hypothetical protein
VDRARSFLRFGIVPERLFYLETAAKLLLGASEFN